MQRVCLSGGNTLRAPVVSDWLLLNVLITNKTTAQQAHAVGKLNAILITNTQHYNAKPVKV